MLYLSISCGKTNPENVCPRAPVAPCTFRAEDPDTEAPDVDFPTLSPQHDVQEVMVEQPRTVLHVLTWPAGDATFFQKPWVFAAECDNLSR